MAIVRILKKKRKKTQLNIENKALNCLGSGLKTVLKLTKVLENPVSTLVETGTNLVSGAVKTGANLVSAVVETGKEVVSAVVEDTKQIKTSLSIYETKLTNNIFELEGINISKRYEIKVALDALFKDRNLNGALNILEGSFGSSKKTKLSIIDNLNHSIKFLENDLKQPIIVEGGQYPFTIIDLKDIKPVNYIFENYYSVALEYGHLNAILNKVTARYNPHVLWRIRAIKSNLTEACQ